VKFSPQTLHRISGTLAETRLKGLQHISAVPTEVDFAFWAVFVAAADGLAASVAGAGKVFVRHLSRFKVVITE
jgi:hypothetical protein